MDRLKPALGSSKTFQADACSWHTVRWLFELTVRTVGSVIACIYAIIDSSEPELYGTQRRDERSQSDGSKRGKVAQHGTKKREWSAEKECS